MAAMERPSDPTVDELLSQISVPNLKTPRPPLLHTYFSLNQSIPFSNQSFTEMELSNEAIWHGELPDDVVVEVLSRLPPKPFFRLKCVSKSWFALSSHASRLNKHLQLTVMGFFYETPPYFQHVVGFTNIPDGPYEVDATLSTFLDHDDFEIMDCCNGLLLVKCWNYGAQSNLSSVDMYVYNPVTRKHSPVPVELLPSLCWAHYETISLAVDPQAPSQFHVVSFRYPHDGCHCDNVFHTFSSCSGRWQKGANLGCDVRIKDLSKGTFLEGRVYRVTEGREIVSVDVSNNTCLVTKLDFPGLFHRDNCDVGQSHGLLHFMSVSKFGKMSIWVSETGDLQKWTLKHQLRLEELHLVDAYRSFWKFILHPEKDILFVYSGSRHILSISLHSGKSSEICALPHQIRSTTCWLYMPCFLV